MTSHRQRFAGSYKAHEVITLRDNLVTKFSAPIAILCIAVLTAWSGVANSASRTAGDPAPTGDKQARTVVAERTVAGASCTGKADWRIRILPSIRKEPGFKTVVLRNAKPGSKWRIATQEIRGDGTTIGSARLRASDSGRVVFADELDRGRVRLDFVATATTTDQTCAFHISVRV